MLQGCYLLDAQFLEYPDLGGKSSLRRFDGKGGELSEKLQDLKFAYSKDGHYNIDNTIAERFFRPWLVSVRTRCPLLVTV